MLLCNYWGWVVIKYVLCVLTHCAQSIYCVWICVLIINVQVKLLHCYVNDFVSFSGIGIELGNLSGHRTLIAFCKLITNYMYIAHTFSWLFSQHGQGKWNFESGKNQGILKASISGRATLRLWLLWYGPSVSTNMTMVFYILWTCYISAGEIPRPTSSLHCRFYI